MRRCVSIMLLCTGFHSVLANTSDIPLEVLRLRAKQQALQQPTVATQGTAVHTFYPGSLKENITALANECGWHTVVWEPDYDYQWVGLTRFHQQNIQQVLAHVLTDFPLQATFYNGNHVLVISPRELG